MPNLSRSFTKSIAICFGIVALAACQTKPPLSVFSEQQVAVLIDNGFSAEGNNYELGLANRVLFDFDSSELKEETHAQITTLTGELKSVGIGGVTIEGHTDSKGETDYNRRLSERRAEVVKQAFVAGGMDPASIRTVGHGETDPIADNATEEGRAENRRVVIVVSPGDIIRY